MMEERVWLTRRRKTLRREMVLPLRERDWLREERVGRTVEVRKEVAALVVSSLLSSALAAIWRRWNNR